MYFEKGNVLGGLAAVGVFAAVGLLFVGCSTIRKAHEAQRAVAPKGTEAGADKSVRLDLRSYSLRQLVEFAMTNRPSVVSARLAVEDARLALKEMAADAPVLSDTPWTVPHLSASGGYAESSGGTHPGGGEGFRTSGNATFGLSLDLLIYDFGRYDARAKAQAERVVAAEQALIDEGYLVFGEVSAAYFNFIQARSMLDVAFTNRADYADQLSRAEAMFSVGEAQQLDVLRAKVDLANAEQKVVVASNDLETCGATFMYVLGVDASRGSAKEVLDMTPVTLGTVFRAFPATHYALDTAYDLARTNSPEMRVVRARLRAASHDVDYAIANLMPSVSASTSFSWSDPLWYWSWGVSAAQSIFEGFRKTTAVDRAVVAMRSAAANVDAAEHKLSSSLESAIAVRDNAVVALLASVESVVSTKENLEMVTAQFAVGDVSRIDFSAAIAQHTQAVGDCISAFYYGQKAEAALYALVGTQPVFEERKYEKVEVVK